MRPITLVLAAATLVLPALAQSTLPAPGMPYPGDIYDSVKQFLVLSDAQLNQLTELQKNRQKADQAIYEQMNVKQVELSRLLEAGSNDTATVGRLTVEINNLRRQLPGSGTPFRASALAVLNEAQKAKLAQLGQALELQRPAGEAVSLNLLDYPNFPTPRLLPAPVDALSVNVVSKR